MMGASFGGCDTHTALNGNAACLFPVHVTAIQSHKSNLVLLVRQEGWRMLEDYINLQKSQICY